MQELSHEERELHYGRWETLWKFNRSAPPPKRHEWMEKPWVHDIPVSRRKVDVWEDYTPAGVHEDTRSARAIMHAFGLAVVEYMEAEYRFYGGDKEKGYADEAYAVLQENQQSIVRLLTVAPKRYVLDSVETATDRYVDGLLRAAADPAGQWSIVNDDLKRGNFLPAVAVTAMLLGEDDTFNKAFIASVYVDFSKYTRDIQAAANALFSVQPRQEYEDISSRMQISGKIYSTMIGVGCMASARTLVRKRKASYADAVEHMDDLFSEFTRRVGQAMKTLEDSGYRNNAFKVAWRRCTAAADTIGTAMDDYGMSGSKY